jgi:three-Cys-motif partner protein
LERQKFGSNHTDVKLEKLANYLKAFPTAVKNQPFERLYIDAFAGTGEIETADANLPLIGGADVDAFISGSVRRALEVAPPFDKYVYIERDSSKAEGLRKLVSTYANRRSIVLIGDANEKLEEVIGATDWGRTRAVVFLDPFGSQVTWQTLERLAATQAVDLWYLFPSGLSVLRQIGRSGEILPEHRPAVSRMFGPHDWESQLVVKSEATDLFGNITQDVVHRATADQIAQFMIKCMSHIFKGGAHPRWLPLGSRNIQMYSLIFACANPCKHASELAHKLAGAVLASKSKKAK